MDKNRYEPSSDLKNVKENIFNGSRTNLVQNRILKKKTFPNLPKNTENPRFFEFPKAIKWPELADNYPKIWTLPQSLTKIFFMSQTQKFIKIFQKTPPPQT